MSQEFIKLGRTAENLPLPISKRAVPKTQVENLEEFNDRSTGLDKYGNKWPANYKLHRTFDVNSSNLNWV